MEHSVTGLPYDALIGVVVALMGVIWRDQKAMIQRLENESKKRSEQLIRIRLLVKQVCVKLSIPNGEGDHDD